MRAALLISLFAACATPQKVVEDDVARPTPEKVVTSDARKAVHLAGLDDALNALTALPTVATRSLIEAALKAEVELDEETRAKLTSIEKRASAVLLKDALVERAVLSVETADADKGRAGAAAAYLASDAHVGVDRENKRVRSPAGQKALGAFLATLPATPPDPVRLARARETVRMSGEVDLALALTFDAIERYLATVMSALDNDARKKITPLLVASDVDKKRFRANIERSLVLQSYFAARFTEDRHSIRELAFWRSPVGKWFASARVDAVRTSLAAMCDEVGQSIPE